MFEEHWKGRTTCQRKNVKPGEPSRSLSFHRGTLRGTFQFLSLLPCPHVSSSLWNPLLLPPFAFCLLEMFILWSCPHLWYITCPPSLSSSASYSISLSGCIVSYQFFIMICMPLLFRLFISSCGSLSLSLLQRSLPPGGGRELFPWVFPWFAQPPFSQWTWYLTSWQCNNWVFGSFQVFQLWVYGNKLFTGLPFSYTKI